MPYLNGVRGAVAEDLSGRVFGYLTVLVRDVARQRRVYWSCVCLCGAVKSVAACEIKSGKTKSCGCFDAARKKTATVKHGYNRTPTYVSWCAMWARCTNAKLKSFNNYGGRGITVCDRWKSFQAFLDDVGERPVGKSLDRYPNNDGNYESSNCRWATSSEQKRNQVRAAAEIGSQS